MTEPHLFILRIPAILIALTIHEFAHGYIAWLKGDNTAKSEGRLSFNPIDHLDVFGTLMLLFGPFGWAKPVPINPRNLDNPKRDIIYVSLAGPVSNIILALIFGYTLRFFYSEIMAFSPYLFLFFQISIVMNLGLSFFNLIPIPPLDGSNVLMGLLPPDKIMGYLRFIEHAPKVLFGLLLIEWVLKIPVFSTIINPIWNPYLNFWQFIIFGGKGM